MPSWTTSQELPLNKETLTHLLQAPALHHHPPTLDGLAQLLVGQTTLLQEAQPNHLPQVGSLVGPLVLELLTNFRDSTLQVLGHPLPQGGTHQGRGCQDSSLPALGPLDSSPPCLDQGTHLAGPHQVNSLEGLRHPSTRDRSPPHRVDPPDLSLTCLIHPLQVGCTGLEAPELSHLAQLRASQSEGSPRCLQDRGDLLAGGFLLSQVVLDMDQAPWVPMEDLVLQEGCFQCHMTCLFMLASCLAC